MKILHVITRRQLRGAEIFASQLSAEFVRQGHEVIIVALQPAVVFPEVPGVTYVDLNLDRKKRLLSLGAWKKFAALVTELRPDIIQANASETLKFTVLSKFFFGWKTPLVYRNANKVSDFIRSKTSLVVNRWLANRVDFVISVSENCRADFVRTFDLPPAKTVTIPIGTIVNNTLSATPGLQSDYWINVASLVPEKNHAGLLRIFKAYVDRGGQSHLRVVGDGRLKEALLQQVDAFDLSQRVEFLGYRQDVPALMQNAHGLLLPSLIEGLPGVILEAMASKVPVVAYDVGGIPEVITDGVTGRLVKKGDEKDFTDKMLSIESNPADRERMITNAYDTCISTYAIDAIASAFLKQYATIIREPSA